MTTMTAAAAAALSSSLPSCPSSRRGARTVRSSSSSSSSMPAIHFPPQRIIPGILRRRAAHSPVPLESCVTQACPYVLLSLSLSLSTPTGAIVMLPRLQISHSRYSHVSAVMDMHSSMLSRKENLSSHLDR